MRPFVATELKLLCEQLVAEISSDTRFKDAVCKDLTLRVAAQLQGTDAPHAFAALLICVLRSIEIYDVAYALKRPEKAGGVN